MSSCPACETPIPTATDSCPSCGLRVGRGLHEMPTQAPGWPAAQGTPSPAATPSGPSRPTTHARFIPGSVLAGRYQILAPLGRGGMGEVYRAEDLRLGQTVALKFLPEALSGEAGLRQRLLEEVRIARRVTHPDVCRVYDIGEHEGQFFLSMEYVDGVDLASLLKQVGRLPSDRAIEISRHICAGLAAAHEKGVLHRDLKPANIMIDAGGNVRITDFGLAVVSEERQEAEAGLGTPAYMSPEQLAGGPATIRSDIYALGLILYEMVTGRPAFEAKTLDAMKRLRDGAPLPRPKRLVPDLDPRIESTILRCLDRDPSRRPATALAVSASLPGGDPIAAALAAGQTPTPEMLAAAPVEGGLGAAAIWVCLGLLITGTILAAAMAGRTGLVQRVAFDRSPAVLADRAHAIVAALGYEDPERAPAWGYETDMDYLRYVELVDPSPGRWDALGAGRTPALFFWYRQSPRPFVPNGEFGRITLVDPPPFEPGMISLLLDPRGRLLEFHAVPQQARSDVEGRSHSGAFDWSRLLHEAGLDPSRLNAAQPAWVPPVFSDTTAAWALAGSGEPAGPDRVEAAAFEGRAVYFQIGGPWTQRVHIEPQRESAGAQASQALLLVIHFFILGSCLLLVRRNLRLGRSDWKGGLHAAIFLVTTVLAAWLFHAPHVASVSEEWELFVETGGLALFIATYFWISYVALEPYLRVRWPHRFVSWSRLLAGRLSDPLVGRDLVIGSLAGLGWTLLVEIQSLLPGWLGLAPAVPVKSPMATLTGLKGCLAVFFEFQPNVIVTPVAYMVLILVFQVILRKEWLAAGLFFVLFTARLALQAGTHPVILFVSALTVVLWLVVMLRFGLLAMMAACQARFLWSFPITSDPSAWYAGASIFALGIFAVFALYGLRTALGHRPLFSRIDLQP